MMLNVVLEVLVFLLAIVWSLFSVRIAMQRLQQSSYRTERYARRLFGADTALLKKDYRYHQFFFVLFLVLGMHLSPYLGFQSLYLVFLGVLAVFLFIMCGRTRAVFRFEKKPFVLTQRALRLFILTTVFAVSIPAALLCFLSFEHTVGLAALWSVGIPVLIVLPNMLLSPVEKQVNNYYLRDAKQRRRAFDDLRVIGITGSYGKTSTKHFVAAILARKFITYMTPGSVNTDLGLAREIREQLRPIHQFFIAEMGAREWGDIRKCAEVAQPNWGILTCIGLAHLETFGSQDGIRKTKGELLESLPADGVCFLNANDPNTDLMRSFVRCRVVTFGMSNEEGFSADVYARDVRVTSTGSSFWIDGKRVSEAFELNTRILGKFAIINIVSAVAVALEAGVSPALIRAAVADLSPVEHRLQLIDKGGGLLVIDDAYNSNPSGFREALDTLALFSDRRKILVTPGMVELGSQEIAENRAVGEYAAAKIDYAVLVGHKDRTSALREGLLSGGFDAERITSVRTLGEARNFLAQLNKAGDIVLFENDLPDLYGG